MRRLTFTNYTNINKLFTPINNGSIAIISFKTIIKDPKIIVLANEAMILIKNREKTDENPQKFTIQQGNFSLSQLNDTISSKIPRIKIINENNVNILSIDEGYSAIISSNLLKSLGFNFKGNNKELIAKHVSAPLPKIPKKVFLYCREIDTRFNEIDSQPSEIMCSIDIENNIGNCNPINPIFIPLFNNGEPVDYLHFKLIDENGIEIIPDTFYLVLYIK